MKEQKINILSDEVLSSANAICFTSNGIIKADGSLTMGAGIAKQFKIKWPRLPIEAGRLVKSCGNICQEVMDDEVNGHIFNIISFPTKYHWKYPSEICLITKSANELKRLICDYYPANCKVYLPFPGIGMGSLDKDDVRKAISPILDDRFIITYL